MADLKQLRNIFDQAVKEEINMTLEKMVKVVSDKYGHDRAEIFNLLESYQQKIDELENDTKSETVVNQLKCMGKTRFGTQCSRARQADSVFCGSHSIKIPYGRFDDDLGEDPNSKKRGRPRK